MTDRKNNDLNKNKVVDEHVEVTRDGDTVIYDESTVETEDHVIRDNDRDLHDDKRKDLGDDLLNDDEVVLTEERRRRRDDTDRTDRDEVRRRRRDRAYRDGEYVGGGRGMQEHFHHEVEKPAGFNLSWGAVLAGAVTFVAMFIVLNFITAALGFGLLAPTDRNPFEDVGVTTGIVTLVVLAVSFFVAGLVSGVAARRAGFLHGFLTWAMSVLLLLFVTVSLLSGLLNMVANITGQVVTTTVDVVGSGVSTTTDVVTTVVEDAVGLAGDNLSEIDTEELQTNVEEILGDTDVPELQPEYLQGLADDSLNDITEAGKEILTNPENADQIIDDLVTNLQERAETVGDAADRDAIANAVAENTDLTDQEAEEAVDNIYNGLQTATIEFSEQIDRTVETIEETRVEVERTVSETVEEGREVAEDVSDTVSTGSLIIFGGLLAGLVISAIAGTIGSATSKKSWEQ